MNKQTLFIALVAFTTVAFGAGPHDWPTSDGKTIEGRLTGTDDRHLNGLRNVCVHNVCDAALFPGERLCPILTELRLVTTEHHDQRRDGDRRNQPHLELPFGRKVDR